MDIGFGDAVLLFGGLLTVVAALSGLIRGTVLSASVLSVALGIALAATDVVSVDATDQSIVELIELALILTLFSDGMFVERELLRRHWSPVARALVIAMPITMVAPRARRQGPVPLPRRGPRPSSSPPCSRPPTRSSPRPWSPPDWSRAPSATPSTSSPGSTTGSPSRSSSSSWSSPRPAGDPGTEAAKLVGEAVVGGIIGVALGAFGGRIHNRLPGGGITARYEGIYAIGFALVAFGLADVTFGNGLIAAFVCGIAMGAAERDVPQGFVEFAENTSAILQVLTFFVFGALIVATGFDHSIPPLVLFVAFALLIARPLAVQLSFVRTGIPRPQKAFMAWFGPKGVASMLFALFVLKSQVDSGELIFDVAAITIIASIVAHGLTDTVGAQWMARRVGFEEP